MLRRQRIDTAAQVGLLDSEQIESKGTVMPGLGLYNSDSQLYKRLIFFSSLTFEQAIVVCSCTCFLYGFVALLRIKLS